jgi:hypothetical protein
MKFPDYKGYRKPKVVKVNTYVTIATYKAINKVDIDMVYIYNSKDDNCILLYYNTLDSIYNILNKKLYTTKKIKIKESKDDRPHRFI